jgi:hypothetical protein
MALCIMSKCWGAGFKGEGLSYIPKNVGMRKGERLRAFAAGVIEDLFAEAEGLGGDF